MIDYTIFYKEKYTSIDLFCNSNQFDLFISAYNDSFRVKSVFEKMKCSKKWLVLPEYNYRDVELPSEPFVTFNDGQSESEIISSYFSQVENLDSIKLCIDITGFMRPHLVYMILYLKSIGVKKFDTIFSDPNSYISKEKTIFSKSAVELVRQINGCEGQHLSDDSNDLLIIGSGYDYKLISSVAEDKANCRKIQVFGLPSLQPDMFQENLIRAYKAEEEIGGSKFLDSTNCYFAPANDPFVTASVLKEIIDQENRIKQITNLYLSPLSTKAQTLGFALFYAMQCTNEPASIIFPFTTEYSRETTEGFSRIWKYTIEF